MSASSSFSGICRGAWESVCSFFVPSSEPFDRNAHLLKYIARHTGEYEELARAFLGDDVGKVQHLLEQKPIQFTGDVSEDGEAHFTCHYCGQYASQEIFDRVLNKYRRDPVVLLHLIPNYDRRSLPRIVQTIDVFEMEHLTVPSDFGSVSRLNSLFEKCLNLGEAALSERVLRLYPNCTLFQIRELLANYTIPQRHPTYSTQIVLTPNQVEHLLHLCGSHSLHDLAHFAVELHRFVVWEGGKFQSQNPDEQARKQYLEALYEETKPLMVRAMDLVRADRSQKDLVEAFLEMITRGEVLYFPFFSKYLCELTLESQLQVLKRSYCTSLEVFEAVKRLYEIFLKSIPQCRLSDEQSQHLSAYFTRMCKDQNCNWKEFGRFAYDKVKEIHPEWTLEVNVS